MGVEFVSYLLNQTVGDAGVSALVGGEGLWTAPDAVRAAQALAQLRDARCFQLGEVSAPPATALALWLSGKAGMLYGGDWSFADMDWQNRALYGRMRLIAGQQLTLAEPEKPTSALGDSMAITSFSRSRDAAVAWLDLMASETGQLIWLRDAKRIVARTALNTVANGASPAQVEEVGLLTHGTAVDLNYPLWPQTYNALEEALQKVLNGSQTSQAAMADVAAVDR